MCNYSIQPNFGHPVNLILAWPKLYLGWPKLNLCLDFYSFYCFYASKY